ncbi:MAG: hypothetical protein SFU91_06325 [Chloroherpetonaceae bacterium]|nr:hypothetical protein [Chloroherpetonaceae bacterium]
MNIPFRNILWAIFNNAFEIILGFGTLAFVTQHYTASESGSWVVFTALTFLITKIREGMLSPSLIRDSAENRLEKENRLPLYRLFIVLFELALTGLMLLGSIFVKDAALKSLMQWYGVLGPLAAFFRFRIQLFQLKKQFDWVFVTNVSFIVLYAGGLFLISTQPRALYHLLFIHSASLLLSLGGFAVFNGYQSKVREKHKAKSVSIWEMLVAMRQIISFGKEGALKEISGTLANRIGVFLSASILTLAETALIGLSQRYVQLVQFPNSALQTIVLSELLETMKSGRSIQLSLHLWISRITAVNLIALPFFIVSIALAVPLIHGSAFSGAIPLVIGGSILAGVISPIGNAFGSAMMLLGKPEEAARLVYQSSAFTILFSLIGMLFFGMYGVLLGAFLAEIIGLIHMRKIFIQELSLKLEDAAIESIVSLKELLPLVQKKLTTNFIKPDFRL